MVQDHLGNTFETLADMCRHWGHTNTWNVTTRMNNGATLQEALEAPVRETSRGKECFDHLGHKFSSIVEMCAYYGITRELYYSRVQLDWSLEDILTKPARKRSSNNMVGKTPVTISPEIKSIMKIIPHEEITHYFVGDSCFTDKSKAYAFGEETGLSVDEEVCYIFNNEQFDSKREFMLAKKKVAEAIAPAFLDYGKVEVSFADDLIYNSNSARVFDLIKRVGVSTLLDDRTIVLFNNEDVKPLVEQIVHYFNL